MITQRLHLSQKAFSFQWLVFSRLVVTHFDGEYVEHHQVAKRIHVLAKVGQGFKQYKQVVRLAATYTQRCNSGLKQFFDSLLKLKAKYFVGHVRGNCRIRHYCPNCFDFSLRNSEHLMREWHVGHKGYGLPRMLAR